MKDKNIETENEETKNTSTKISDKPMVDKSTIIGIFVVLLILFCLLSFTSYIHDNSEEVEHEIEKVVNEVSEKGLNELIHFDDTNTINGKN